MPFPCCWMGGLPDEKSEEHDTSLTGVSKTLWYQGGSSMWCTVGGGQAGAIITTNSMRFRCKGWCTSITFFIVIYNLTPFSNQTAQLRECCQSPCTLVHVCGMLMPTLLHVVFGWGGSTDKKIMIQPLHPCLPLSSRFRSVERAVHKYETEDHGSGAHVETFARVQSTGSKSVRQGERRCSKVPKQAKGAASTGR